MLPCGLQASMKYLRWWFCSMVFMLSIDSGFILMNNLFKGTSEKGTEPGDLADH